jgi:hypothetical protein
LESVWAMRGKEEIDADGRRRQDLGGRQGLAPLIGTVRI